MSPFTIKIGKLWSSSEGTTQQETLEALPNFTIDGMEFSNPLSTEVLLIKLKNEVSVILTNTKVIVGTQCQRCLTSYKQPIFIQNVECQFFSEKPEHSQDFDEIFFIDLQHMSIDLSEMLRQEIILHFPMIPVCLESCKGLCQSCGRKLESEVCLCDHEASKVESPQPEQQPFKNLKHLIYGKEANT